MLCLILYLSHKWIKFLRRPNKNLKHGGFLVFLFKLHLRPAQWLDFWRPMGRYRFSLSAKPRRDNRPTAAPDRAGPECRLARAWARREDRNRAGALSVILLLGSAGKDHGTRADNAGAGTYHSSNQRC